VNMSQTIEDEAKLARDFQMALTQVPARAELPLAIAFDSISSHPPIPLTAVAQHIHLAQFSRSLT